MCVTVIVCLLVFPVIDLQCHSYSNAPYAGVRCHIMCVTVIVCLLVFPVIDLQCRSYSNAPYAGVTMCCRKPTVILQWLLRTE